VRRRRGRHEVRLPELGLNTITAMFGRISIRSLLMRSRLTFPAPALALAVPALAAAVTIAGCGESTKTVSVSGAPPTVAHATDTTPGATTTSTSTTGTTSTSAPATTNPSTTRTAPAPAFAEQEHTKTSSQGASAEGLEGALAAVHEHGYVAKDTSEYHPDQTLRVLIGTGAHSGDGYDKRAFFFIDGRYIGTDASSPSAQLSVVSQGDTEVTLAYSLYRSHDPLCCPSGGQAKVTFQLNDGKLVPLDPIPPAESSTGLSRQ
jgi:hypothetical protein